MKRTEFGAALLGLGALAVFGKRDALAASGYEVTHSDAQWMASARAATLRDSPASGNRAGLFEPAHPGESFGNVPLCGVRVNALLFEIQVR